MAFQEHVCTVKTDIQQAFTTTTKKIPKMAAYISVIIKLLNSCVIKQFSKKQIVITVIICWPGHVVA